MSTTRGKVFIEVAEYLRKKYRRMVKRQLIGTLSQIIAIRQATETQESDTPMIANVGLASSSAIEDKSTDANVKE